MRQSYCNMFYSPRVGGGTNGIQSGGRCREAHGATTSNGVFGWGRAGNTNACNGWLKRGLLGIPGANQEQVVHGKTQRKGKFLSSSDERGADINIVQYLGIAADEPKRIERHSKKKNVIMPLVDAGWTEAMCYEWCKENDLLAPTYTTSMRDGCWFCHNQGINQLRSLRKNYPDLWKKLMQLDLDSPVSFKADGHSVHDFDKRFEMEDKGIIKADEPFYWSYLNDPPCRQFDIFEIMNRGK